MLRSIKTVIIALFAGLLFSAVNSGLYAQSSQINATLCDTSGPELQIDSPASDSVVNQPSIVLKGSSQRTTQIDIYINNVYSQTVAVGLDGLFETILVVNSGTNTIDLKAHYSCNQTTKFYQLVITYSAAGELPTQADDTAIIKPGSTRPLFVTSDPEESSASSSIVENISRNFSFKYSLVRPIISWVSLIVAAVGLLLFIKPRKTVWILGYKHELGTRAVIIIRLAGVLITVIFATIVQV